MTVTRQYAEHPTGEGVEPRDSDTARAPQASTKSLLLCVALAAATVAGCGGKAKGPRVVVAPNVVLGDCVAPESAGVLSDEPSFKRADRDLNRDGEDELVMADERLCRDGNCYWNVFASREGCYRYIGTVEGATLELGKSQSEQGFRELRAWWRQGGGRRYLLQSYRFDEAGYRLRDVLMCRLLDDDRLQCAQEPLIEE